MHHQDGNEAGRADGAISDALPPDAAAILERLEAFENVGEVLWPFVRVFGLCGAHPTAIAAVVALGKLLGHTDASQSTIMEISDKVRIETLDEVASALPDMLRGSTLSAKIPELCDKVRQL